MEWKFEIFYMQKSVKIDAKVVYSSAQIERIKLTIDTHEMIVENNRPFLMSKNLNKKHFKWKVREGRINNASAFVLMINSIEAYLRNIGKKPFVHPKNH